MAVSLYTPIKLGELPKKQQIEEMKKYGYYRDGALSNDNEQVYWNPTKHKLLVNVRGTHTRDNNGNFTLKDWGTDLWLATGHLKETNRYKEADDVLAKSKAKYGVKKAMITSHSLGGGIANGIGKANDKVYTLDAGYTIGQKARDNVKNIRTDGDWVSTFSPWGNTTTLKNPNWKTGNTVLDGVNAHAIDNIKNTPIKVDKNKGRYNTDYGIKYVNLVD